MPEETFKDQPLLDAFIQGKIKSALLQVMEAAPQFDVPDNLTRLLINESFYQEIPSDSIDLDVKSRALLNLHTAINWLDFYRESQNFHSRRTPVIDRYLVALTSSMMFARANCLRALGKIDDRIEGRVLLMAHRLDQSTWLKEEVERSKELGYTPANQIKLYRIEEKNVALEFVREDLTIQNQAISEKINERLNNHFVLRAYDDGVPLHLLLKMQDFHPEKNQISNLVDEEALKEFFKGEVSERDTRRMRAICARDRGRLLQMLQFFQLRKYRGWEARAHAMIQMELVSMDEAIETLVRYVQTSVVETPLEVENNDTVKAFLSIEPFEDEDGSFAIEPLFETLYKKPEEDLLEEIGGSSSLLSTGLSTHLMNTPQSPAVPTEEMLQIRNTLVQEFEKEFLSEYLSIPMPQNLAQRIFKFEDVLAMDPKIGDEIKYRALSEPSSAEIYKLVQESGKALFYGKKLLKAKFYDAWNARVQCLFMQGKFNKIAYLNCYFSTMVHARITDAQMRLEDARLNAVDGRRYDGSPILLDDDFFEVGTNGYQALRMMHEWIFQIGLQLSKREVDPAWLRFVESLSFSTVIEMDGVSKSQHTHMLVGVPNEKKIFIHLDRHEGKVRTMLESFYRLRFTRAWCIKNKIFMEHYHDQTYSKQIQKLQDDCLREYTAVKKELVRIGVIKEAGGDTASESFAPGLLSKIKNLF